jgi:hypothetical protein
VAALRTQVKERGQAAQDLARLEGDIADGLGLLEVVDGEEARFTRTVLVNCYRCSTGFIQVFSAH